MHILKNISAFFFTVKFDIGNIDKIVRYFLFSEQSNPLPSMLCTHFRLGNCKAPVKSGEGYPNTVSSFGIIRAFMKMRTPNSRCTYNT